MTSQFLLKCCDSRPRTIQDTVYRQAIVTLQGTNGGGTHQAIPERIKLVLHHIDDLRSGPFATTCAERGR